MSRLGRICLLYCTDPEEEAWTATHILKWVAGIGNGGPATRNRSQCAVAPFLSWMVAWRLAQSRALACLRFRAARDAAISRGSGRPVLNIQALSRWERVVAHCDRVRGVFAVAFPYALLPTRYSLLLSASCLLPIAFCNSLFPIRLSLHLH